MLKETRRLNPAGFSFGACSILNSPPYRKSKRIVLAARDRVWAHSHRACMCLLLFIFVLESPSILTMSKRSPPVGFSEPLPVVFGFTLRALATKHFHIVAA
jgi:hypothetical protein